MLICAPAADHLIQAVLADITIDDGVGCDNRGEAAVLEQPVDAAKKVDHQFA